MLYVLDTSFFTLWRYYYPDIFPAFWDKVNETTQSGVISSVYEVKKELEKYGGAQKHLSDWVNSHTNIFTKPSDKEQFNMKEIFKNKKFQSLVEKSKMKLGGPFADPLVIAKAMLMPNKITVVTGELPATRDKTGKIQGTPKIPDICNHFKVVCITPETFMQQQDWQF